MISVNLIILKVEAHCVSYNICMKAAQIVDILASLWSEYDTQQCELVDADDQQNIVMHSWDNTRLFLIGLKK